MKKQYKRIVIFPDTHGRTFWKEPIERFENDKDTLFIFLGDYFDPYPSIDGIVMDNAYENFSEIWERLKDNENVIFLLGNHDWHYLPQLHREYGCRRSDFYLDKIGNFFLNNFDRFNIAYEYDINDKKYLFTHAGVIYGWVKENFGHYEKDLSKIYSEKYLNEIKSLDNKLSNALWQVGPIRWGNHLFGSPLWADAEEHVVENGKYEKEFNIYQIFGHSLSYPAVYEYEINENWAMLDCGKSFVLDCETGIISPYHKYIDTLNNDLLNNSSSHISNSIDIESDN